ncbi:MAG TPA: hypothetical protein VHX86_04185 [Tepidisphaeraceae bacterium]|nr:hypothetical protein [Tepidisphaeraceae bacterium]
MRKFLVVLMAAAALTWAGRCIGQTQPTTAPSDVPDVALHGDLLGAGDVDLVKADKTAWTNAWLVISGGKPTTWPVGPNDPLPIGLQQTLGPIFNAGVVHLVYGVSLGNSGTTITLCLLLRKGASESVAVKDLRRLFGNSRFEHDGPWLVTRLGAAGATPPLSPQADFVREALKTGGDVPVRLVYVTSEPVKRRLLKGGPPPAALTKTFDLYLSAKYIYVGMTLGAHPQIEGRWVAPDENGTDEVIKAFDGLRQKLKQPNNGMGLPPFFGQIADQFQPTREGNITHVVLGQKELTNIFATIISASMNGGNAAQEAQVRQEPVSPDWKPLDPATDSAEAQMRLILAAIAEYDEAHQALPASLDDLLSDKLLPGPEIFHDPRSGKDKGFIYLKPAATKLAGIGHRDKTAILFEDKDGHADKKGLVGYADGHVGTRNQGLDTRN